MKTVWASLTILFFWVPPALAASPWSLEQLLGPERLNLSLQILLFLTVLSLAPAIIIILWNDGIFKSSQDYGFPEEVRPILVDQEFATDGFPILDMTCELAQISVGVLTQGLPEDWLDPEFARTEEESLYALQSAKHLLIGFPLMIKNEFYGVMLVEDLDEERRFRQKRIEIISGFTQQIALSIQNEYLQNEMVIRERLETEVQLARQIQRTFLPDHLPEYPNWDLAATWITARQVGGDF